MANNADSTTTLEDGNVYFFYRPRVEEEAPEGPEDVQRLYMVLSPKGAQRYRLILIGRKHLPDTSRAGKEREWGFVDKVRNRPQGIARELQEQSYTTKTRGKRHLPAARPAGEGVYQIVRHDNHTHLVYVLELPKDPGGVQKELEIDEEASYIISVKNPEAGSPRAAGLGPDQQAEFPQRLKETFRGRKFSELDPPDFLNYEGAELLLVSAAEDPEQELGIHLDADSENRSSADIFRDLHVKKSEHPLAPLFEGAWE